MSPHLDEVCKKYGYKTVNVATWRDPSLSVLPGGRGPRSGYKIPAGDVAKPFIPTYKVKYAVPEPTDDEASDGGMTEEDSQDKVDSPLRPDHVDAASEPTKADDAGEPQLPSDTGQSVVQEDAPRDEHQEVDPKEQDHANSFDDPADEAVAFEPIEAACEDEQGQQDMTVPSAPPEAEQVLKPETGSEEPNDDHDTNEAIQADVEEAKPSGGEIPHADGEHAEDKKVAFAPGTPEPKPTQRKKKSSKGSKSKKRRTATPMFDDPANEQPLNGMALEDIPPPPPDPSSIVDDEPPTGTGDQAPDDVGIQQATTEAAVAESDDVTAQVLPPEMAETPDGKAQRDQENSDPSSQLPSGDAGLEGVQPETQPAAAEPSDDASGGVSSLNPVEDEPQAPPPIDTKASKKKSGKKSSKKKPSKSKSKEVSSSPSGLGIDFPDDQPIDAGAGVDVCDVTPTEADSPPASADLPSKEVDTVPVADIADVDDASPASERNHVEQASEQSDAPDETLELDEDLGAGDDAEVELPFEPPAIHDSNAELASGESVSPVDSGVAIEQRTDGPDHTLSSGEDAEHAERESTKEGEDLVGDLNAAGSAADAADEEDIAGSSAGDQPVDHLSSDDVGPGDADDNLSQTDRHEQEEGIPDSVDDPATERPIEEDDEEEVTRAAELASTHEDVSALDDSASEQPDPSTQDDESVAEPKSDDEMEQGVVSNAESIDTEKPARAEVDSPQDASEAHGFTPEEHCSDDDNDAGASGATEQVKDTATVEGEDSLPREDEEPEPEALEKAAAAEDTADVALADDRPADQTSEGGEPASESAVDAGPAEEGSAGEASKDEAKDPPADEGPADEGPAEKGAADEGPADNVPADEALADEATTAEDNTAEEAPGEAPPDDSAPNDDDTQVVEPTTDEAPAPEADGAAEEAPTEEDPSGEAAERAAPADETPVDDAVRDADSADAAPTPDANAPEEALVEARNPPDDSPPTDHAQEDAAAPEEPPSSPVLSKTSSHGSRKSSTHWDRPHRGSKLQDALAAPVALKRPHGHRSGSKDEVVHRERRGAEEAQARRERRRREERKAQAVRALEEEKKRLEADERRQARRAARREEEARLAREEARREAERRRRRRHEREMRELERREEELRVELAERKKKQQQAGEGSRSPQTSRSGKPRTESATSSRPAMGKVFSGESVHRGGFLRGDDGASSRQSRETPRVERGKTSPAAVGEASGRREEEGGKRARRGEGGERTRKRRSTLEEKEKEKPRGFLSSLFRRS